MKIKKTFEIEIVISCSWYKKTENKNMVVGDIFVSNSSVFCSYTAEFDNKWDLIHVKESYDNDEDLFELFEEELKIFLQAQRLRLLTGVYNK